jgi:predicted metal-dependent hydrolase
VKKTQNIVNYSGIGQVLYVRNPRARNFTIRINQRGEVRVTVPGRVGWRRAESFFLSRESWVQKKLEQMNSHPCKESLPSEGESLWIRGREFPISLQRGDSGSEDAIWRILRNEAREYLPGRVAKLSEMHGYRISGLKIRKMKTRWGSCTSRKSINLNSWLMMVPEPLRDYVILHELAHTRFPNHGSQFWKELDRTTGGLSDMYRKELRKQKIMCFAGTKADQ